MNTRRAAALLLSLVVAALGVAWFLRAGPPAAPAPSGGPPQASPRSARAAERRPQDAETSPPAAPAVDAPDAVDVLGARILEGDAAAAREAAAELRRRARTDDSAWRDAAARLLDPSTPEALREALAFVLGTVESERTDPLLLEALAKFGATPAFARAALFALGAKRTPPDEDDVFGMGDRPWGAAGPGGLGITVMREIDDAATRASAAAFLRRDDAPVRRAAALALRHSLAKPDARAAFEAALASEKADVVAQELGESLVQSARDSDDPVERGRLFGLVLSRAADEDLDGLRFRVEDDLGGARLGPDERRSLLELAKPTTRSLSKRSFAFDVLALNAANGGDAAERQARLVLDEAVAGDPDAPVRDLAARLLGRLPGDEASVAVLARAASSDGQWNVRYSAVETIAATAPAQVARGVLAAAAHDPDERVAARAKELLAASERR